MLENILLLSPLTEYIPMMALSVFFVFFNLGFSGVPFIILGEIFPPGTGKSIAISCSVACIWIVNFVTTKCYFSMVLTLGYEGMFIMNAAFCLLASCIVFIALPETKGKTLAEVQETFKNKYS